MFEEGLSSAFVTGRNAKLEPPDLIPKISTMVDDGEGFRQDPMNASIGLRTSAMRGQHAMG